MRLSDVVAGMEHPDARRLLPELPVIIIEGPAGTGKRVQLDNLEQQWSKIPIVRVSFPSQRVRTRDVCIAVADELTRKKRFPRNLFGRLFLGLAAIETQLPPDPNAAKQAMNDLLRDRDRVTQAVGAAVVAARAALRLAPSDTPAVKAGEFGLAVVGPLTWAIRRRQRPYEWFGLSTGTGNGIDGLVQLNRWAHTAGVRPQWVETVLQRAFLEDLRTGYASWWNSSLIRYRPAVLLDDIFLDGSWQFVDDLLELRAEARTGRLVRAPTNPTPYRRAGDPVLVVATSSVRRARQPDGTIGARSITRPPNPPGNDIDAIQPIHILDVTVEGRLTNEPIADSPAHRRCQEIAAGHRLGFRKMLDRANELPAPTGLPGTMLLPFDTAHLLLNRAFVGVPEHVQLDVLCLAAIDDHDPLRNTALAYILTGGDRPIGQRVEAAFACIRTRMWSGADAGTVHPLFRRCLLTRLADDSLIWENVFDALTQMHREADAGRYPAGDRKAWIHHYRLGGTGSVVPAAEHLSAILDLVPPGRWIATLERIVTAPRRGLPNEAHGVTARLNAALHVPAPGSSAQRLVAGLWLRHNHADDLDGTACVAAKAAATDLAQHPQDPGKQLHLWRYAEALTCPSPPPLGPDVDHPHPETDVAPEGDTT